MEGLARIFVEVYGCSSNQADFEIARGLLREAGHNLVEDPALADASVILSCTVKTPTQRKVAKRIGQLSDLKNGLVVAGCMPKAQRELVAEIAPMASVVSPDNILRVVEAVEKSIRGEFFEALNGGNPNRACLPRMRKNAVIHIAPISSGCIGNCSYCIVKRARGDLTSFPAGEIIEDASRAIKENCREIWVTAEDTAAYQWSGVKLPALLQKLSSFDSRYFIRVGMMTPNAALPILDDLVESYRSDRIFKFVHVPVQSGNDEILQRMGRQYYVDDFRRIVQIFRETFNEVSISTDIICGFPGETEEQFADSINLLEEVKPDVLNISRFWPRPGTMAAEMDGQLHSRETKERSRKLSSLWKKLSLEGNEKWIGWEGNAIVDEMGRHGSVVARNTSYKPIVIKTPIRLGDILRVRVTKALKGYLMGQTV